MSEYRKKYPEKWASYREKNRARLASEARIYRKNNKEKISKKDVLRKRLKRKNDPLYAISHRVRSRVSMAYKGKLKADSTKKLIGCDFKFFCLYLESKFKPGMSWGNRQEWQIDHIIPISKFDLSNIDEAKKAFHWSNCQPLWKEENLRKGNRILPMQASI